MPSPIQNVLVPIDLSNGSERAIEPALRLATRAEVPLILFSWSFDEGEAAVAKDHLVDLAATLAGPVTVEVAVTENRSAAPAIVDAASRHAATVCMAAHGRSGVGRFLLGSVAEKVLAMRRSPSLLVGPHVSDTPPSRRPTVVACVDGSELSESALPVACAWARQLKLPLQLLNVLEPGLDLGAPNQPPDVVEAGYVARLAAEVDCDGQPDYEVLHRHPAEAIASFVADDAELIVMATHGRSGVARTIMGSVAMRVVHRAHRPVLVVPPPRAG